MKNLVTLLAVALGAAVTAVGAQANVGVSIGINQPGVYGRIDFGDAPPPPIVMARPVIIAPQPVYRQQEPTYLYVPIAEQRDWRHKCRKYEACGRPVYFVQESWVRERYQREHPEWDRGRKRGWDKRDKHAEDREHDKGLGNGPGKGH